MHSRTVLKKLTCSFVALQRLCFRAVQSPPSLGHGLQLDGIEAVDLNSAWSGGMVGLMTSLCYLSAELAERVLLVCTDTMAANASTRQSDRQFDSALSKCKCA